jgi:imidazolonepropionase-like amidohydrolase
MQPMLLTNARVINGLGENIGPATISIRDGRIERIEEGATRSPGSPVGTRDEAPRSERVVDLGGRTVLPGLIDAHVHLSSWDHLPPLLRGEPPRSPALRVFELANAGRALLAAGITTVRDVGSQDDHALLLREAVRLGLSPGPRILTCARIVTATAPGGAVFGTMYREADGPDEMRKAVREQIRAGANFIKVMATGARSVVLEDPEPAQLTRDELDAVIDEAHRMGKRVTAHAEGLDGCRLAIEAGVDSLEHGLALHREPRLLRVMAERGTVLVPTLSTFHDVSETRAEHYAPGLVEQAVTQRDEAYRTLRAAREAGVTLAMGFDSYPLGENALELVRMINGGLTPMEAITAATSGSAAALGLTDIGRVAEGAAADLLVVDGDPLADPELLLDPGRRWLVLQAGRAVAAATPASDAPARRAP